jgi:hypothetical protein
VDIDRGIDNRIEDSQFVVSHDHDYNLGDSGLILKSLVLKML